MENKKVTVIMPAYNAERFIGEAISSVIAQTYENWELLVIDDCSTDGTFEIAKSFEEKDERIKVFKNEKNLGVARTRNRGIDASEGEYVAFIDSDDAWLSEKLFKQVKKNGRNRSSFFLLFL